MCVMCVCETESVLWTIDEQYSKAERDRAIAKIHFTRIYIKHQGAGAVAVAGSYFTLLDAFVDIRFFYGQPECMQ